MDLVSNVANTAMLKRRKIVEQNQKINAFGGQLEHLREVFPEHKLRNEEIQNSSGETLGEICGQNYRQVRRKHQNK